MIMRTLAKIIGYGLVVLLCAAAVGFAYKYTNGFNEDFKTFYIECDGKQILTTENEMTFSNKVLYNFYVKYTFDKEDAKPKGYKLKVVPNAANNFEYTVNGENYLYSKVGDLTSVFEPVIHDTYFELYFKDGVSFSDILKKAHNGKNVSVPSDALTNNPYPFQLQISSYNGKVTYKIDFNIDSMVVGKTISPSSGTINTPTESGNSDYSPVVAKHSIKWRVTNNDAGLVYVSVDCPTESTTGEKVKFIAQLLDDYHCSIAQIDVLSDGKHVSYATPTGSSCAYEFNMPNGDVELVITLTDIVISDFYSIGYDTLGNGSMASVLFYCNDVAAPGDWVTASISLTFDEKSRLEITNVVLQNADTGEDIKYLEEFNGLYEFTMPSCNVTVMIYLMAL